MKTDDNEKLWELLGKTRHPMVSPFFARNVLRAVREKGAPRRGFFARIAGSLKGRAWQYALAGTCALAAVATFVPAISLRHHHAAAAQSPSVEVQIVANPDYETINHLDELVADEESSVWLDDSVH